MKHSVAILPLILLFCIVLLGCEPPPQAGGGKTSSGPPAPPAAPLETRVGVYAGGLDDLAAPANAPAPPPAATPPAPQSETVTAGVGVGSKGRSLDTHEGPIVTPAKTFFAAKEIIAFKIQVPDALRLYEASNGEAPKSHQEFMDNIITANRIQLPMLPPGHEYVYDVPSKTLMVKRPPKP